MSGSVFLLALGLLSGCAAQQPDSASISTPQIPKTSTPNDSPTPDTATNTASPAPITAVPVGINCDEVMSAKALYDYNPNFAYIPNLPLQAGTQAQKVSALQGISCSYENLSGGTTVSVAVAKVTPESLPSVLKELAATSKSVTNFGASDSIHGFFSNSSGLGVAQVVNGNYWIVAESSWFGTPEEASEFIAAAINATK